jgi:Na+-driven multidrug efflux pump
MKNKNIGIKLTGGGVFKTLIMFALPILLGNIFQQLYGFIDSMVVSRTFGENSFCHIQNGMRKRGYNLLKILK